MPRTQLCAMGQYRCVRSIPCNPISEGYFTDQLLGHTLQKLSSSNNLPVSQKFRLCAHWEKKAWRGKLNKYFCGGCPWLQ